MWDHSPVIYNYLLEYYPNPDKLDIKALERFFGFHDAIKNIATQGVENIKTSDLVMDCGVFESRLDGFASISSIRI